MADHRDAMDANRQLWNARVAPHLASALYDVDGFVAGRGSLTALELELLGEVRGRRVLHLQCHFGQDTLDLARRGAEMTGLDISDTAIDEARILADRMGLQAKWIRADVQERQPSLEGRFDMVFTSYGVLGWLPELEGWAANIRDYLKPGGKLVLVEFHPIVWMFNDDFTRITFPWSSRAPIVEERKGSYADVERPGNFTSHWWDHGLGDILGALLGAGLRIDRYVELDGSPHDIFPRSVKGEDGLYRIGGLAGTIPMVFGLTATAPEA
ncbi:MAG: class I SAM-dependent methyltransferase [Flavobacteriales bacterium]|nr:class I SAM-dependent methyltransferase [Flavobacteriales bacterium]